MQESRGDGRLNKDSLGRIKSVEVPRREIFELPEKILQFGTGVLLRGLPDYYIDEANRRGVFNGRIVVVKSTRQNSVDDFKQQDGLYTLCLRGWQEGKATSKDMINSAISRVLDSGSQWAAVLDTATNPEMKLVISNTTEVGIVLDPEDRLTEGVAPRSFPGKLLAFLWARFAHFGGDPEKGMIIIPTELIQDNGRTLKKICLELARINALPEPFIQWLDNSNEFCDSLVDRIVSGRMQPEQEAREMEKLGYKDQLMIMAEVYSLWAIQTASPETATAISFQKIDPGVIVTPDIEKYRQLKLFLLNAPHTFTCIIAQALGFQFVNEAMNDKAFEDFIRALLIQEAVPAVVAADISTEEATAFAQQVLDRFKNPFIDHRWSDISKQMTLKMGMRCLPLIRDYYTKFGVLPDRMLRGLAAYLLFLRNQEKQPLGNQPDGQQSEGSSILNGVRFPLTDAKAAMLATHWDQEASDLTKLIREILKDDRLWPGQVIEGIDKIEGLAEAISGLIKEMDFGKQIKI